MGVPFRELFWTACRFGSGVLAIFTEALAVIAGAGLLVVVAALLL